MNKIETARKAWKLERDAYEAFSDHLKRRVEEVLHPLGFWYDVSARAKDLDSLIKKLLAKAVYDYDSLPDKAGVRVVVRYRSDIDKVIDVLRRCFDCAPPDDKEKRLGDNRVGYLSVHLDKVSFQAGDPQVGQYPPEKYWAELQVRTLAQHLWSEMSHDTIYKNDDTAAVLTPDLKRRVNLMAGQIEIADREFERLNEETATGMKELFNTLERYYFTFTAKKPDVELSLQVLEKLVSLYQNESCSVVDRVEKFIEEKRSTIERVFADADSLAHKRSPVFLHQPEVFVLYERLENDLIALRRAWSEMFPEEELEELANVLGIAFD
jgi:ppGpp synthetase/RelA/SpoT-type nucleotidyltranferase